MSFDDTQVREEAHSLLLMGVHKLIVFICRAYLGLIIAPVYGPKISHMTWNRLGNAGWIVKMVSSNGGLTQESGIHHVIEYHACAKGGDQTV